MLHLLAANPVRLSQSENLLFLPFSNKTHHLLPQMRLMACLLSGCRLETEEFLNKQPELSLLPGETLPRNGIWRRSDNGVGFVLFGKYIPVEHVFDDLNFLQCLFNLSISYSSINTARSALSLILPRNGCGSFGQHFLVKKFIRGVYNLRTPAPKYSYIWDVSVVLEF